jgi:tetratricopeptide (TPR) repeat protein
LLLWCILQAAARFGGAIAESSARGDGASFANEATGTFAALMAMVVALFLYPFNIALWFVFVTLLALAALVIAGDRQRTVDIEERPLFSLAASLGFIVGLILVLCAVYFSSVRYLADARYARALIAGTPREVMDGLARAIDLNPSDDRILRDASQVALVLVRDEVAKGATADGSLVQNLMASSIQLAQRAAQIQPDESLNWNNLGSVYQSLTGLVEDVERLAEDAFTKAGELRPGDPAFDNRSGAMWLARADLIRSLATRQNASQLQQQYSDSLAKAETAFNRALEKSSSFGLAIYNRAAVYDRQNKVAEAITDLETIAPANANEPTLMFELGLLYARANRLDEAMAAMRRAVLLAPQYANARWYLALLMEEAGDTEGALEQLREIEKNNADNEVLKAKILQLTAVPPVPATADPIDNPPLQ